MFAEELGYGIGEQFDQPIESHPFWQLLAQHVPAVFWEIGPVREFLREEIVTASALITALTAE